MNLLKQQATTISKPISMARLSTKIISFRNYVIDAIQNFFHSKYQKLLTIQTMVDENQVEYHLNP